MKRIQTRRIAGAAAATSLALLAASQCMADVDAWERTWVPEVGLGALGGHVVVDDAGSVYTANLSVNTGGLTDIALIKYDGDGNVLWERLYDGPVSGNDAPTGITTTDTGVLIVGTSPDASGPATLLLEYDVDGNVVNERRVLGPAIAGFMAPQVAVGSDGRQVIATDDGNGNGLLVAFDAKGATIFEHPLTFTGFSGVSAMRLTADDEAIVVTIEAIDGGGIGYVTRFFDADGTMQWSHDMIAPTGLVLSEAWISPSPKGSMIIGGSPEGPCAPFPRVWALSSTGALLWETDLIEDECDFGLLSDLTAAPDGGVYVIIEHAPSSRIAHVDVAGDIVWSHTVDEPGMDINYRNIAVDASGAIIAAGADRIESTSFIFDLRLDRYSPNGDLLDTYQFAGEDNAQDSIADLAVGADGLVVMTGTTEPEGGRQHAATIGLRFFTPTPGDIDLDGDVDTSDLLALLSSWGFCPECPADLDDDQVVGTSDLLILLANWSV